MTNTETDLIRDLLSVARELVEHAPEDVSSADCPACQIIERGQDYLEKHGD